MKLKKSLFMLLSYIFLICCVFLTSCKQNNNTIESDLMAYKEVGISEIILYRDSKIEKNFYSESGYTELNSICETSISEIYKAKEKTTVELITLEAKRDMDLVEKIEEIISISFFTLQEGYEAGKVSRNDLITMAHLVNENKVFSITDLSLQVVQRIKQEYSNLKEIRIKNLQLEYYGQYNGFYAIIMYDITAGVAAVETKVEIGDVLFYYPTAGIEIIICKIN